MTYFIYFSIHYINFYHLYTIIKKCRICNSKHLINVLDLGNQALANNFSKIKKNQKNSLKLLICSKCKLVQISVDVNPDKLFSNYFWVTSTSTSKAKEFSLKFTRDLLKKKQT